MRVSVKEVPLSVRRRAAQHLESLRGSEIARDMQAARLGDEVVPIYRPDMEGVAYWEFSVFNGVGHRQILRSPGYPAEKCRPDEGASGRDRVPVGFIIASDGRHDFPIAHWSLNRLPPSLQIATDPRDHCGGEARSEPKRLYRLDALSYAAEDENGELAGQSGQLPGQIHGLPHNLARYAGQIASSIARVLRSDRTDDKADNAEHELERSAADPPQLTRTDEGGWKALKDSYADAFGPLLDQLRARAAKTWEIEDAIHEFGEGIISGESHRVALLDEACVELVGYGAQYVRAWLDEQGAPALVLTAAAVSLPHEAEFDAIITYPDGERERLPFFLVSRDVPSNVKAERERLRSDDRED